MIHSILFGLFVGCIGVQCAYALYFFTRVFTLSENGTAGKNKRQAVTVIICVKNEAHNLKRFLPEILSQDYTDEAGALFYEVLVVNDASTDDTEEVLQQLQTEYPHLCSVTISANEPRTFKGKKFALSKAVEAAKNEWLLMTDADCLPSSRQWLSLMTEPLQNGKEIVCGYGAYKPEKGFLNGFIRWETLHTFIQYSSYIAAGLPYMAVGRNLACTKTILQEAQRSAVWNALPSGDDDLLIQTCSTKNNTEIVADRSAFTTSEAKKTWKEWLHQKQRHISTGKYYKPVVKFLLGMYALTHALSWLLFFILLFFSDQSVSFFIFMMRCAVYWIIWETAAARMKERKLLRRMPVYDVSWALYNFVLSPFIFFKNKRQWK